MVGNLSRQGCSQIFHSFKMVYFKFSVLLRWYISLTLIAFLALERNDSLSFRREKCWRIFRGLDRDGRMG